MARAIAREDTRSTSRLTLVLAGVAFAAVVVGTVLILPAASRAGFTGVYATDLLLGASFSTIGVLVTRRRSENRIGWLSSRSA